MIHHVCGQCVSFGPTRTVNRNPALVTNGVLRDIDAHIPLDVTGASQLQQGEQDVDVVASDDELTHPPPAHGPSDEDKEQHEKPEKKDKPSKHEKKHKKDKEREEAKRGREPSTSPQLSAPLLLGVMRICALGMLSSTVGCCQWVRTELYVSRPWWLPFMPCVRRRWFVAVAFNIPFRNVCTSHGV